jgi:ribonuclease BN (tRNA processing enzyme)
VAAADARLTLRLLGSGGFVPTDRRETACALLRRGNEALLLDAGTGARRLWSEPGLLDGIERLDVVLSHFHLDHTVGLFYLAGLELPLEIWGGGDVLEGIATGDLVKTLVGSPFAPPSFVDELPAVRELAVGATRVGPFEVRARVQPLHANRTLALRVGDALAWCTDTAYDADNVSFAQGVELLCHEAFTAGEQTDGPGHTASGEAARLAGAAGVERLLLIHVNPERDDDEALVASARRYFAASEVATDHTTIELRAGA